MTPLRQRLLDDLRLRGFSPKTQEAYIGAVRQLAEYCHKSPELITDDELRKYLLYLTEEKGVSASTLRVALTGIKFFFENTLKRDLPALTLARPRTEKRLPTVLSIEEVQQVLSHVRRLRYRVLLSTLYACGLRLREGTHLRVGDIDGARQLLHVHLGKGHRDRYVPLPQQQLEVLRAYWRTHRNREWMFPGKQTAGAEAGAPIEDSGVQRAFRKALEASGIGKKASVHTLRHSYATHLLEAGVNLRVIQTYLGHSSPMTTAIYTHLTKPSEARVLSALDPLMAKLTFDMEEAIAPKSP